MKMSFVVCARYSLLHRRFFRPSKLVLRSVTLLPKIERKNSLLDKSEYRVVYSLPYIGLLSGFMRSVNSVTIVSLASCPFLFFFDPSKVSPFITAASAGLYFLLGSVVKKFIQNVIGKMYVNKEGTVRNIIISSLDHNGNRIDRVHSLESIINTDYPNKIFRAVGFIALSTENSGVLYLLNVHSGVFLDQDACDIILGYKWEDVDAEKKQKSNERLT